MQSWEKGKTKENGSKEEKRDYSVTLGGRRPIWKWREGEEKRCTFRNMEEVAVPIIVWLIALLCIQGGAKWPKNVTKLKKIRT